MSLLTKMKYSFTSKGMDKETFTVVSFKGFEAISKPYKFEILLVSDKANIDPLDVLQNSATFTIHRDEEDNVEFNGILMQFEETQEFNGYLFFKAVLTPKLWWLSLTHHNQVFLDLSAPDIMEHALKDGGLNSGIDFSFNLMKDYQPIEYVCQYDESHFNFVSRWAEREGMYYFFEQTPNGEKVIFTDSKMEHKDLLLGKDLIYLPQSGLDATHTKEVIQNFLCKHNMLPQKVFLKDYNYLKPSFSIEGIADVDENGRGENYIYGVHFDSPEEGNRLAQIRAEALICRKSIFHGESSVPYMVPGYTFDLNDHYKKIYNRKYLVSEVTHEGHQTGYLVSGLTPAVEPRDEQMFYSNTFTAIYSDEQFRAEHLSEKPKISGTINAKIDAASSGEHAELDEYGRYKVILPFDRSGRYGGKASAWFRMMQSSAGQNQGMHFPLHKGTEVLLTFIDGNPDRPVIAGAMPNPETSSPVKDKNQTKSVIQTGKSPVDGSAGAGDATARTNSASKNYIEFEDASGSERIRTHSDGDLWTEAQNRYVEYKIGVPSTSEARPTEVADLIDKMHEHSGSGFGPTGMELYTDEEPYRNPDTSTSGADTTQFSDCNTDAEEWEYLVDRGKVTIAKGDTFNTQEGNIYDFGGYWNYNLGNCYIEDHLRQSSQQINPTMPTEPTEPTPLPKFPPPDQATQQQYDDDMDQYELDMLQYEDDKAQYRKDTKKDDHNENRAVLNNDSLDQDLLDVGGPDWTEVDWGKAQDSNSSSGISNSDVKIGSTNDQWDNSSGSTNVWVEKKFGDSYDYLEGDAISVTKGSSLDIQHGGKHIDMVFRGSGAIKSWAWQDGSHKKGKSWDSKGRLTSEMEYDSGVLNEKAWNYFAQKDTTNPLPLLSQKTVDKNSGTTSVHTHCRDTGNIIAYSSVHQGINSVHSFNFNWANTAKASFNFAAGAAFSFNASIQGSININLSAAFSFTLNGSLKASYTFNTALNFDFSHTLLDLKLENTDFKMKALFGKLEIVANEKESYITFGKTFFMGTKLVPMKMEKKSSLKLTKEGIKFVVTTTQVKV